MCYFIIVKDNKYKRKEVLKMTRRGEELLEKAKQLLMQAEAETENQREENKLTTIIIKTEKLQNGR